VCRPESVVRRATSQMQTEKARSLNYGLLYIVSTAYCGGMTEPQKFTGSVRLDPRHLLRKWNARHCDLPMTFEGSRRAYWATRIAVHFKKHRQKPSNARPTQLIANIEEAIATTDTKVAMA
jgi:hypothetical protein